MLTRDRLLELLSYDQLTGCFVWRVSRGCVRAGSEAGSPGNDLYLRIKIDRKLYLASRLAWFYVHGVWPKADLDHKDRNPPNIAIANLREATRRQNQANTIARGRSSSYKGVVRRGNRWIAQGQVGGKQKYLGMFVDAEDAARAYDASALAEFGEFARVNFLHG